MNETDIAEPPTKIRFSSEGNSSIMILNHYNSEEWTNFMLLYIPNRDFSSTYKEDNPDFHLIEEEFYTIKIYNELYSLESAIFSFTKRDGTFSIIKNKKDYFTLIAEDYIPTIIGAKRDYFIPFLPFNEDFIEDLMYNSNSVQKEKIDFLEIILNNINSPFTQIKNPNKLPQHLRKYDIKGNECNNF